MRLYQDCPGTGTSEGTRLRAFRPQEGSRVAAALPSYRRWPPCQPKGVGMKVQTNLKAGISASYSQTTSVSYSQSLSGPGSLSQTIELSQSNSVSSSSSCG